MADPNGSRLYGLQILRFFAAFAVLFEHVMHEALSFGIAQDQTLAALEPFDFGVGVDVFFVISGFIMAYITADKFARPGASGQFLTRRLVRLVPLYWLFTLAMLAAMVLVPGQLAHTALNPAHILASYLFVPWLDVTGLAHPILGLGWTLNYEMYFYVIFAVVLLLPRRIGLWTLAALFCVLALLHPAIDPAQVQLSFWTDPIILEFLFGIGLAVLATRGTKLSGLAAVALIVAGITGLGLGQLTDFGGPYHRVLLTGVPAALLVAGTVFAPLRQPGRLRTWLVLGGDASFALYLSHPFSINVVILCWQKLHLGVPWLFIGVTLVVAVLAAMVVHLLLERPLLGWLNAALTRPARPGQSAHPVLNAPAGK